MPTMSMYCAQDLCQQCLCTVFRTYANNVCTPCSRPMPTMSMHCVQDLCRQRMQSKASEKPEPLHAASRIGSVSESAVRSPSSRSSTSSWSVTALFSLPCHRLFICDPVYHPPFCPHCHCLFLLSCPRSIALTSVLIVTVCSFYSHCLFLLS